VSILKGNSSKFLFCICARAGLHEGTWLCCATTKKAVSTKLRLNSGRQGPPPPSPGAPKSRSRGRPRRASSTLRLCPLRQSAPVRANEKGRTHNDRWMGALGGCCCLAHLAHWPCRRRAAERGQVHLCQVDAGELSQDELLALPPPPQALLAAETATPQVAASLRAPRAPVQRGGFPAAVSCLWATLAWFLES